MSILSSEIVWRAATLVSDSTATQNGGRMAAAAIPTAVKNNLFPDVTQSERASGSTKFRKAFIHVASAENIALQDPRIFIDTPTAASDWVTFAPGTQTDTQDTAATARAYGIATLQSASSAGATNLTLVGENATSYATLQPFRVNDLIRVATLDALGTGTGTEEFVRVSAATYSSGTIALTFAPALANAYASGTKVSSVYEPDDILATVGTATPTSTAGTFNGAGLTTNNKGAIDQTWTLTFSSASAFTASGSSIGALASPGSTAADYAPINPATGTPYFSVSSTAWGGTWAAANTLVFATNPAAVPVWYRREVPANAATVSGNQASLVVHGESA